MSYKGKKNIYVCDRCHRHIVTVDVNEGVTPFSTPCKVTYGCGGLMLSSMYRVFDQSIHASHEWYRPSNAELWRFSPGVRHHVENGGLLLRSAQG